MGKKRKIKPWNKGLTKKDDPRIGKQNRGKNGHAWNYGLEKGKDSKMVNFGKKSILLEKKCLCCEKIMLLKPFEFKERKYCSPSCSAKKNPWNKNITAESNEIMSRIAIKNIGHKCSWKGLTKEVDEVSMRRSVKMRQLISDGEFNPQNNGYAGSFFREDLNAHFRSSWEANIARILNYLGIQWEYESKKCRFNTDSGTLILDFYLPEKDIYLEPKGFLLDVTKSKMKSLVDLYPDVVKKVFIIDSEVYGLLTNLFKEKIVNWE
jgi:hypothetical protein